MAFLANDHKNTMHILATQFRVANEYCQFLHIACIDSNYIIVHVSNAFIEMVSNNTKTVTHHIACSYSN